MKIPIWFDTWLLKQKNKQLICAVGVHYFWEIICWKAYKMGKKAGSSYQKKKIRELGQSSCPRKYYHGYIHEKGLK